MIDWDGMSALEATQEYAEATMKLVHLLSDGGTVPKEGIAGWIAGVAVTAIIEAMAEIS